MAEYEYTLSYAYALEEAFKKDNNGFDTVEAFAAHTIAAMIETALKGKADAFNRNQKRPNSAISSYFKMRNCENAVQYMLFSIEMPLTVNSGINDEIADAFGELIDANADAIIEAHPEIVDSEEGFYYE